MAERKITDDQKFWEQRIDRARKVHDGWMSEFKVNVSRAYYEGKQNDLNMLPNEFIANNKIFSQLQVILPSLYSIDPYFYVRVKRTFSPLPQEYEIYKKRADSRQAYLNYLKKELRLRDKCRMCILDAFMAFGVMKIVYNTEEQDNPNAGKPLKDEFGEVVFGSDGKPIVEPDTIPINEHYVLERVRPDDFLFDDDAGPLYDSWRWVAECRHMTWEEARSDKRYSKRVLDDLKPFLANKADNAEISKIEALRPEDVPISIWTIYNIQKKTFLSLVKGGNDLLIKERSLPVGTEEHCFAILRFFLRDNSPYPIPLISQAIDPQREFNLARSRVLTHRKRFNRKYQVFAAGLIDKDTEMSKLESGEDGTCISLSSANPAIFPISDAPLDQQTYLEISALNNDIIEIIGAPDQARGISDADSATEAAILEKRLVFRENDRSAAVVDFLQVIAEKLDQLVQTHFTREEMVRITGPDGDFMQMVRPVDYEEINGEFEYEVNVGSMQPQLPGFERTQMLAFLQALGQFPFFMWDRNLLEELAEKFSMDNKRFVDSLFRIGQMLMQAQAQQAGGGGGSLPGIPTGDMAPKIGGLVGGSMGGNVNGGGASQLTSVQ